MLQRCKIALLLHNLSLIVKKRLSLFLLCNTVARIVFPF